MSASRSPTERPSICRPSARLQAVVDLPTPPLPEATAMTWRTPGSACAFGEGALAGRPGVIGGRRRRAFLERTIGGEAGEHALDAGKAAHRGLRRLPHRLQGLGLGRRDRDGEHHAGVGVDHHLARGGRRRGGRRRPARRGRSRAPAGPVHERWPKEDSPRPGRMSEANAPRVRSVDMYAGAAENASRNASARAKRAQATGPLIPAGRLALPCRGRRPPRPARRRAPRAPRAPASRPRARRPGAPPRARAGRGRRSEAPGSGRGS